MECCTSPTDAYVIDDHTRLSVTSAETEDSEDTEESAILSTDYRKVTPLFRNIERENWEGVLMFLTTGKWSNSLMSSSNEHLRSPSREIQVKTWVTSYDRKGEPEWSQLPIHAAISYLAPYVVVQKIIQLYPKGVHCTDNEGMLPAHLAFGFGAPDNVVALLLEAFPGALDVKGLGGRYPYECCDLGPNRARGQVHKIVTEQVAERTRAQVEEELIEFTSKSVTSVGVKGFQDLKNKTISDLILDLLRDRKELQELKEGETKARSPTPNVASSVLVVNSGRQASAVVTATRTPKTSEKHTNSRRSSRSSKASKMVSKLAASPKTDSNTLSSF